MADKVKMFTKKRDPKEGEKFGDHVGAILFALRNGPQPREKVVAIVEKRLEGKTCQPAARIVSFQAPRMVKAGLIKVEKVNAEAAAPAKGKAAGKKAAKKSAKAAAGATAAADAPEPVSAE